MLHQPFPNDFIASALTLPVSALSYEIGRRIQLARPGRYVFETVAGAFDFDGYLDDEAVAASGEVRATERTDFRLQQCHTFCETHGRVERTLENALYEVDYQGETLEVLVLSFNADDVCETRHFLIGREELVRRFFERVCRWSNEVTGQILVFENGSFQKDEQLFAVVQSARLDTLILKGSLKEEIVEDISSFFARRHVYEKYGVPHKRGILFYGPPGNGKTHLLKGLVRVSGVPCIYVRSIQARHAQGHELIGRVFEKARAQAPCVLVFEDLETIVTDQNRSYFLNELDGFQSNHGILTLATTNFPERIDPAIVDRPSRFDRKYCLDLPGVDERARFLARFSEGLGSDMRLDDGCVRDVAERTGGFSFAYLKELTVSSLMAWVDDPVAGSMGAVMRRVANGMKDQVRQGKSPKATDGKRVGLIPEA